MREGSRLLLATLRLGLFAACAGISTAQHRLLFPAQVQDPSLVDVVAIACCTNLVMAACFLVYAAARRLARDGAALWRPRPAPDGDGDDTPLVCLARPGDAATLHFRDVLRSCHAHARLMGPHSPDKVYVTPSMLWYYVYTVGLATFGLSYAVQCSSLAPSLALTLSSSLSAAWCLLADAPRPPLARTLAQVACGGAAVAALALVVVDTARRQGGGPLPQAVWSEALHSGWLGALVPLCAPPFITGCRHRVPMTRLASGQMVLFALPFTTAVSVCYLSLYVPLQHCASSAELMAAYANATYLAPWLYYPALQQSSEALLGAAGPSGAAAVAARAGIWVAAVAAIWAALVAFAGGMIRTDKMTSSATCLAAVFAAKQALLHPSPLLTAAAAVAGAAAAVALAEHCTAAAPAPPPPGPGTMPSAPPAPYDLTLPSIDGLFGDEHAPRPDDDDDAASSVFSIGNADDAPTTQTLYLASAGANPA